MSGPNFELITELQTLTRRDFPVAVPALLGPLGSNPLTDGEWMELDDNYQLIRGSGAGKLCVYPVHTERGRYDTQAIGKTNVLFLGQFEAETKVADLSNLHVGDKLMVGDVTYPVGSGLTKRGLLKSTGASGKVEVGYVTKLDLANAKVRFVRTSPVIVP
jgi:hypothetical protein